MDFHDKAIVLLLSALFEELIEKESEKTVKPRKANKKVKKQRKSKKYQTRPRLLAERRQLQGHFQRLMNELRIEDPQPFVNFLRMEPDVDELVQRVGPRITKTETHMRKALSPGLKIALTVRYLASGDKYPSLTYSFRVGRNTICLLIPKVCEAIVEEYKDEFLQCPANPEEWNKVEEMFRKKWNIPHAIGAIDGKHVAIRKPAKSGSLYHNSKGFFSLVLMVLVDGDYLIRWVDVLQYDVIIRLSISSVSYKRNNVRNFFRHFRTEFLRIPAFFLPPKTGVFVFRQKP